MIGMHCTIGAGSIIRDSYIFSDTSIGSGCVIEYSIIGAGVVIKEQSKIDRGCLIGDGVVIGPEAHLLPFERLSKKRTRSETVDEDDEDSDFEEVAACKTVSCACLSPSIVLNVVLCVDQDSVTVTLGKDSNALVWPRQTDDDDDDDLESPENRKNQRFMRIGAFHY